MRNILTLLPAAVMVLVPQLPAADPWKDESGHGRGEYKYEEKYGRDGSVKREWKSGDCKYEYKADRGGVKEEYKCDGPHRHYAGYGHWAPPLHGGYGYGGGSLPLDLGLGRCNRELIGQILGGAGGAAAGSQIGKGEGRIVAIVGGGLAGFLLGGEIGRTLDEADHLCVDQVLEYAPDGRAVEWHDPDQGGYREIVPHGTFESSDGRYCREYTAKAVIGGETVQTYGTACRQPDGSWQKVG